MSSAWENCAESCNLIFAPTLSPDRKRNRAPSWPKVFAIGVSKVDRRRKADYFDDPEVPGFSFFFFFDDSAELSELSELADFSDLDDSSREPFFA